jgi:uncharacterized delta-60 repeat protein
MIVLAASSGSFPEESVTEAWTARFNTFVSRIDISNAIAADASGNVYVTGLSYVDSYNSDIVTIKYDAAGNRLWTARYNGPADSYDSGQAIAVDSAGNVYVAGSSRGVYSDADLTTLKYDAAGNQLWVARYNGPGDDRDSAEAVAVDASGNVYVTGYSTGAGTYEDVVTIKYDTAGGQLWAARYDGPGSGYERANAIALDPAGNVHVTGTDVTLKYDGDGNLLWAATGNGDYWAVGVDAAGNVYVAGTGSSDIVLIKYDAAGNALWIARHDGPAGSFDEGRALALDAAGNAHVAGYVTTNSGSDMVTLKYDGEGRRLWQAQTSGGSGLATSIAVDDTGNVYVAGRILGGGVDSALTTLKFDAQGNPLWIDHCLGYGEANGLVLDPAGSVHVTGWRRVRSQPEGGYEDDEIVTITYDAGGIRLWLTGTREPASSFDQAVELAVDDSGNVYAAGNSTTEVDLGSDSDIVLVKFDSSGREIWADRYEEPAGSYEQVVALAVDPSGNAYVTGFSLGGGSLISGGNYDIITLKYDAEGNRLWAARYDGPAGGYDHAAAIAVDAAGYVYVTGVSTGNGTSRDIVTIKYDGGGNLLWESRYNGPANGSDEGVSLAVDSGGNVCVSGTSAGAGADTKLVTIKYSPDGAPLWTARYNDQVNRMQGAEAVATDLNGNVYVLGYDGEIPIRPSLFNPQLIVLKYGSAGNLLWSTTHKGPNSRRESAAALVVDGSGNAFVACTSTYYTDQTGILTLKYDASGSLLWSAASSGMEDRGASAAGLALDPSGRLFVTGTSDGGGTGTEIITLAYDTFGSLLWTAGYNGPYDRSDTAAAIRVGDRGSVIVAGNSTGQGTGSDIAIIRYAPAETPGLDGTPAIRGSDEGCFVSTVFK